MFYHIDTDVGVDDALALVVAHQAMGSSLLGISTVAGNISVAAATRSAKILMTLIAGPAVPPLYQGAAQSSDGFQVNAEHIHGQDGLGGATSEISGGLPDFSSFTAAPLSDIAHRPPGSEKITLIGIGPATNLPLLVELYGRAAIADIVIMSGVFFDEGNITPAAEFNAYCDPGALNTTISLGIPLTFIPLDICRKIQLSRVQAQSWSLGTPSPLAALMTRAHMSYMNFYQGWEGMDGCFPHDTIAVLAALHPGQVYGLSGDVSVCESGTQRGRTEFRDNPASHVRIVTGGRLKWVRQRLQTIRIS